jgi:hypothetical protein
LIELAVSRQRIKGLYRSVGQLPSVSAASAASAASGPVTSAGISISSSIAPTCFHVASRPATGVTARVTAVATGMTTRLISRSLWAAMTSMAN